MDTSPTQSVSAPAGALCTYACARPRWSAALLLTFVLTVSYSKAPHLRTVLAGLPSRWSNTRAEADSSDPSILAAAQHVDAAFTHRFGGITSNASALARLDAGLELLLASPPQYMSTLPNAPEMQEAAARRAFLTAVALQSRHHASAEALADMLLLLHDQLEALGDESCHPVTRRVAVASIVRLRLRMLRPASSASGGAHHTGSSSSSSSSSSGKGSRAGTRAHLRRPQADRHGSSRATAVRVASSRTARSRGDAANAPAPAPAGAGEQLWTVAVRALVYRILRLLYDKHRRGAAYKGAIEFLHVSKSGGTSMCEVASSNGCNAQRTSDFGNCMVKRFDDKPRWVNKDVHAEVLPTMGWRFFYRYSTRRGDRNCTYRDEFMRRKGFTFYANEHTVHGGLDDYHSAHLCPQFVNVIMLREPGARMLSHMRWVVKVYMNEYEFKPQYKLFFEGKDAAHWRRFVPAAVDNFYVRLLLGEATFYLPAGALDESHLAAARLMLLQYDLVLLLEEQATNQALLQHGLGWKAGLDGSKGRSVGQLLVPVSRLEQFLPADRDALIKANGLDQQLYEYGALLQQVDGFLFDAAIAGGAEPFSGYLGIGAAIGSATGVPAASLPVGMEAAGEGVVEGTARVGDGVVVAAGTATTEVKEAVRCGYATREEELLGHLRDFSYDVEFPRIYSEDEKVKPKGWRQKQQQGVAEE